MELVRLRGTAVIMALFAALASVGFVYYAGRESPQRLLLVLMSAWAAAPFLALAWANGRSRQWSRSTQTALVVLAFILAVGAPLAYVYDIGHPRAKEATMYVAVPGICWLLVLTVVPLAILMGRRRPQS